MTESRVSVPGLRMMQLFVSNSVQFPDLAATQHYITSDLVTRNTQAKSLPPFKKASKISRLLSSTILLSFSFISPAGPLKIAPVKASA
jgi:hypothetical protein